MIHNLLESVYAFNWAIYALIWIAIGYGIYTIALYFLVKRSVMQSGIFTTNNLTQKIVKRCEDQAVGISVATVFLLWLLSHYF